MPYYHLKTSYEVHEISDAFTIMGNGKKYYPDKIIKTSVDDPWLCDDCYLYDSENDSWLCEKYNSETHRYECVWIKSNMIRNKSNMDNINDPEICKLFTPIEYLIKKITNNSFVLYQRHGYGHVTIDYLCRKNNRFYMSENKSEALIFNL